MEKALNNLAEQLGSLLLARGLSLSLAESCTGGLGAEIITRVAGSSAWFDCAVVSYSNASKVNLLKVASDTLDKFGAVSEQTAVEMASGVMAISGSQLSAAVTGIAGPAGGTQAKPVGTVCFAGVAVTDDGAFKPGRAAGHARDDFRAQAAGARFSQA